MKVLVAEDSPANRELLRELLEGWGYEVAEAEDGAVALQKIKEMAPDLAILDIQMPVLDGFSVLRLLREDQRFNHLPILALTAFAMSGDRERALAAGFAGYHSKPIDSQQLKTELERIVDPPEGRATD